MGLKGNWRRQSKAQVLDVERVILDRHISKWLKWKVLRECVTSAVYLTCRRRHPQSSNNRNYKFVRTTGREG